MVQVRNDVVSRTQLAANSQAVRTFPAVLQVLSARPLDMMPLSESLIADLADAVAAVTGAKAAEAAELLDLKVNHITRAPQSGLFAWRYFPSTDALSCGARKVRVSALGVHKFLTPQMWMLGSLEAIVQQHDICHLHRRVAHTFLYANAIFQYEH